MFASNTWASDLKVTSLANFRIFKLLVKYEDNRATERYFVKLILVVKHTEWLSGTGAFDVKCDNNFDFGGYFIVKIVNIG